LKPLLPEMPVEKQPWWLGANYEKNVFVVKNGLCGCGFA
jgi:hypothetical protein